MYRNGKKSIQLQNPTTETDNFDQMIKNVEATPRERLLHFLSFQVCLLIKNIISQGASFLSTPCILKQLCTSNNLRLAVWKFKPEEHILNFLFSSCSCIRCWQLSNLLRNTLAKESVLILYMVF